jgi:hypothetical protein
MNHETWWSIFSDPSHIIAELLWTIIQDIFVVGLFYKYICKRVVLPRLTSSVHKEIDREHGISHEKEDN